MQTGSSDFGFRVARYRTNIGISQMELGNRADISTNTIQRIESGKETKTDKVLPICSALNISPNELFGYGELSGLEPELSEALKMIVSVGKEMKADRQVEFAAVLKAQAALLRR